MILDIAVIICFLLSLFIGYKTGFLSKFIKIASVFFGAIFAFLFCDDFAKFLSYLGLGNPIKTQIYENIVASDAFSKFKSSSSVADQLSIFFQDLGFPEFLAKIAGSGLSGVIDPYEIAQSMANSLAHVVLIVISFIFLLFGTTIIVFFLKKFVKMLRKGFPAFRVVDGVLGTVFLGVVFIFSIYTLLAFLSLYIQMSPGSNISLFFTDQLKLNTNEFGIMKYLYENNIVGNLLKLFF